MQDLYEQLQVQQYQNQKTAQFCCTNALYLRLKKSLLKNLNSTFWASPGDFWRKHKTKELWWVQFSNRFQFLSNLMRKSIFSHNFNVSWKNFYTSSHTFYPTCMIDVNLFQNKFKKIKIRYLTEFVSELRKIKHAGRIVCY